MIYLKNIREKQTVYIPRTEINSKVVVIKSYDEGYTDGIVEGKKLQKLKLTNLTVSENGVYKREDGWNEVEIDVPEIAFETQEKNITVSKDVTVVQPDSDYDGITKVTVNATQYGQTKYNDGAKAQKDKLTNLSVTSNGTYNRADGWNEINVNVPSQTLNLQEKNITLTKDIETVTPSTGYDGLTKVSIDATWYVQQKRNEGYTEGHFQGKTEGYEGGKADGLEEGYANGYADGKAEGGSITTKPLYVYPKWEDANLVGDITYRPETYDTQAFSLVTVNVDTLYSEGMEAGYTQGYNEGYEEGKESGSTTSKIKVFDYGVNIKGSTFTTIPEWMDFEGATNFGEAFRDCEKLTVVNDINTDSATSMSYMFWNCKSLETVNISAPNATTMEYMFDNCTSLKNVTIMNSSKVTDMSGMFYGCTSLQTISRLDTGNYFKSGRMFEGCRNLTTLPQIIVRNLRDPYYMFYGCDNLVNFGGFLNLKYSLTSDGVLTSTPNLSYDSCINILNGLYDFTGNGETPDSNKGKLKVHQNFLNLVGDQISIATNKGWTITA